MDNESKFCTSCGKSLPAGADFCPYCGASRPTVKQTAPTEAQPQPQKIVQPQQASQATTQSSNTTTHIGVGWLCAVLSLFIPIAGIASIVLGALAISKDPAKKTAAIFLIVFSCIFMYLGFTGFGTGFFNGLNGN